MEKRAEGFALRPWFGLFRQQDGINDVNHTIAGGDVCLGDLGLIHGDGSILHLDVEFLTVDGLGHHGLYVGSHDFSGHDVIGQDAGELGFILWLEQIIQGAFWKLGKGFIRRREDGEGSGALQSFDQSSSFDRRYEGGEISRAGSDGDDVFARGRRFCLGRTPTNGGCDERDNR